MNATPFNVLSTFYTHLWQYLNTFFDDTRWLDMYPNGTSQQARYSLLEQSFAAIRDTEIDGTLYEQIRQDFAAAAALRQEFEQKQPLSEDWFKQVDKLRSYAQDLGLRYTEMAVNLPNRR